MTERAGVARPQVACEFRVDRGVVDIGRFAVVQRIDAEHAVEGAGPVIAPPPVLEVVGRGAAVTVDRVGQVPDDPTEFLRSVVAGDLHQLAFHRPHLRGPFRRARGRDHGDVRAGDVAPTERQRHLGQLVEFAGQFDMRAGGAVGHATHVP